MKFKKTSIFIKVVILVLVVYAGVSLAGTKGEITEARAEQEILQAKVDAALQKNAELQYDIEHASDDETIEEIARTKLGLVEQGEKIFYDVGN